MPDNHPLQQYDYDIPEENIGKVPAEPRDHARLLIYDSHKDALSFDYFYNLQNYLPADSTMVMNNTGVIPARIVFTKDTGGKVEGLVLFNEGFQNDGTIPIIVMKKIGVGRKLYIENYEFVIHRQEEQYFYIKPEFDSSLLVSIMVKYGRTPTPRYLGKLDMSEEKLRERYQTIFSEEKKSVAAPTASLHFTERVFSSLEKKNIERVSIALHVGMGTFSDVSQKNLEGQYLHTEPIHISAESKMRIRESKEKGNPIIAVGTTAIRAIESQSMSILDSSEHEPIDTHTDIFILPGYTFRITDILITNFHVPKSSLMALVDAFLIDKKSKKSILELYEKALKQGFKFYSFGDSMVIL